MNLTKTMFRYYLLLYLTLLLIYILSYEKIILEANNYELRTKPIFSQKKEAAKLDIAISLENYSTGSTQKSNSILNQKYFEHYGYGTF